MGCLFALFAGIFPRLALFMVWVARPALVSARLQYMASSSARNHIPAVRHADVRDPLHPGFGLSVWEWFWVIYRPASST